MEEILIAIIQFLIEGLGQAILEICFEWAADTSDEKTSARILIATGAMTLGVLVGYFTIKIFPNSLIHYSWLRCLNLLFAPYMAYRISKWISNFRRKEPSTNKLLFAVLFTFGLTAIRLIHAAN